jgi:hypothetical protein
LSLDHHRRRGVSRGLVLVEDGCAGHVVELLTANDNHGTVVEAPKSQIPKSKER